MAAPRVTAISIFYNAAPFLAEAIESVLAQDFSGFELLLVDDGSTAPNAGAHKYAEFGSPVIVITGLPTLCSAPRGGEARTTD